MRALINSFDYQYDFLSNFYACSVMYAEDKYPTVEHAFQAVKTLLSTERSQIKCAYSPGMAKILGRRCRLRSDWELIKMGVMENLLRQKFTWPEFRERLLDTGDTELIEGNTWGDKFWGVCDGVGENHLGKLLMKIRGELNDNQ